MVDESIFDLQRLRNDLQTERATYQGTDEFKGQKVYRILDENNLVLLLDMHYRPVNVLQKAHGPGTGEPIYDMLALLSPLALPASMWDMSVPQGFKMGTLPAKP